MEYYWDHACPTLKPCGTQSGRWEVSQTPLLASEVVSPPPPPTPRPPLPPPSQVHVHKGRVSQTRPLEGAARAREPVRVGRGRQGAAGPPKCRCQTPQSSGPAAGKNRRAEPVHPEVTDTASPARSKPRLRRKVTLSGLLTQTATPSVTVTSAGDWPQ